MASGRKLRSAQQVEELKAALDAAAESGGVSVSNKTPGRSTAPLQLPLESLEDDLLSGMSSRDREIDLVSIH